MIGRPLHDFRRVGSRSAVVGNRQKNIQIHNLRTRSLAMKTLLLLFSFCFALTATEELQNTLPKFIRQAAKVWPCDAPKGCPLSERFAKDDPQGDTFLTNHVVWLSVRNETDAKTKGRQQHMIHAFDPWIRNLQKRKVIFVTVVCGTSKSDTSCKTFDSNYIYAFMKSRKIIDYSFDEVFEIPADAIIESLREVHNLPVSSSPLESMVDMIGLPWEKTKLFVLTKAETSNQDQFTATELGGLLQQFGVPVFQVKDEDIKLEKYRVVSYDNFAVFDTSNCNLQTLRKCNFLRAVPTGEDKLQSTVEELACDIFLSKYANRKISVKEHDAEFIRSVIKICPVVVLIQEDLAGTLPTTALDMALKKYKDWKLVTVLFDGKTAVEGIEELEATAKSGVPARILLRKDRWSDALTHALEITNEKAFGSALEDKVAIYEFQRSTRPEVTYLRFGNSEDSFFLLNHDLQSQLNKAKLGLLSKARHINGRQFQIARKLPYVMIHFYQSWNPVCRAVHETILRVKKIFKDRYKKKSLFITSINCFKDDATCLEQGVKTYPTLKIYSRGAVEDFKEMVTVRNLLKPAVLSLHESMKEIVDEKKWEKVLKDFAPVMDLLFVGVDLSESMKTSFDEAAKVLKRSELLVEANRAALPAEILKALPASGCIFALDPKLRSVEGVLSKETGMEDILDFVKDSNLFILTELTIGGLFEIQQQSKPLLIAFVREMDAGLTATLLSITRAYKGQAFVRWMNASSVETVGVMQAYNIAYTPSLLLKINDKIFPYTGPKIDAKLVDAWFSEVTGNEIPAKFTLKEIEHRTLAQYLDHVGGIYDTEDLIKAEAKAMPEEGNPQPPQTQMKDEL